MEITSHFSSRIEKDSVPIDSNNRKIINQEFEVIIPTPLFGLNFRENLIDYLKREWESHAYNTYYINSFNYLPLLENELPLAKIRGNDYYMKLCLETEIIFFNVGDNVFLKLAFGNNIQDQDFTVYGENEYILCKINLSNDQILETSQQRIESIHDNVYNKIYKNGNSIRVKITKLLSNKTQKGFAPKLNMEGIII